MKFDVMIIENKDTIQTNLPQKINHTFSISLFSDKAARETTFLFQNYSWNFVITRPNITARTCEAVADNKPFEAGVTGLHERHHLG